MSVFCLPEGSCIVRIMTSKQVRLLPTKEQVPMTAWLLGGLLVVWYHPRTSKLIALIVTTSG